jgi:ketosteroid isomerase-like protein
LRGKARNIAQTVSTEVFDQFTERFECWNRGELDQMQAMYAEDGVFDVSAVFTDVPPARGHQHMRRQWEEVWETWGGLRLDPVGAFDVGDARYVVDVRLWGKGKRSGVEVDQRFAFLYTVRPEDEKIISAQLFPDVAAAISAAESSASRPA